MLEISNLCDIEPIELRNNKIALYVMMDRRQIKKNIEILNEVLNETKISKLRVVK